MSAWSSHIRVPIYIENLHSPPTLLGERWPPKVLIYSIFEGFRLFPLSEWSVSKFGIHKGFVGGMSMWSCPQKNLESKLLRKSISNNHKSCSHKSIVVPPKTQSQELPHQRDIKFTEQNAHPRRVSYPATDTRVFSSRVKKQLQRKFPIKS